MGFPCDRIGLIKEVMFIATIDQDAGSSMCFSIVVINGVEHVAIYLKIVLAG